MKEEISKNLNRRNEVAETGKEMVVKTNFCAPESKVISHRTKGATAAYQEAHS